MSTFYNKLEIENWLGFIYPQYKTQTWHSNSVFHPGQIKHFSFFKLAKIVTKKISPLKICGLRYESNYHWSGYWSIGYEVDWKELFYSLNRLNRVIDNYKSKEDVLEHIHKDIDRKIVFQYGDHYFIQSGRHRLCLAKFLDLESVEVLVYRYEFNKELFVREMNIERYLPKLKEYKLVPRDFVSTHTSDHISLNITGRTVLLKKIFVGYLVKRFEILKKYPYKGYINIFKARLSNKTVSLIENENELFHLDYIIDKIPKERVRKTAVIPTG